MAQCILNNETSTTTKTTTTTEAEALLPCCVLQTKALLAVQKRTEVSMRAQCLGPPSTSTMMHNCSQAASPGICQQHMHTRTRQKLMQTHGSSTETTAHMNIYVLVIYKPKQITHTHTAKQREYYIYCTQ